MDKLATSVVFHTHRHRERGQSKCFVSALSMPLLVLTVLCALKSLISLARWAVGKERWRKFDKIQLICRKGPLSAFLSPRRRLTY